MNVLKSLEKMSLKIESCVLDSWDFFLQDFFSGKFFPETFFPRNFLAVTVGTIPLQFHLLCHLQKKNVRFEFKNDITNNTELIFDHTLCLVFLTLFKTSLSTVFGRLLSYEFIYLLLIFKTGLIKITYITSR